MNYVNDYEKIGKIGKYNKYILMSKSPRRRDLLSFLKPEIASIRIDERAIEEKYMEKYKDCDFIERAGKACSEIAKAKSDVDLVKDCLYISSDTMVIMDDKIYGKPRDMAEAREMFMSYFGKSHFVITGVCLRSENYLDVFYSIAEVRFTDYYKALDEIIDGYLREENVMDKAGAYGIQDLDPRLISFINGDINTIIGLPVSEVSRRILGEKN
ncbi:Maf family protein [Anaerococcus sp.]|uniref:Maf family protein n=1 Tax=Anaerococcus sp. TaxID=1872515 RepID=UPI002A764B84|nr:Maf family protein [Anaerococcus sp.]MDY2928510.1 Maf family protein [Anaerococcus sp.]